MKIYTNIKVINKLKNAVVTTGTFDGVHLGHKKLISRLNQIASDTKGESVLVTFHPHPRMVLFPDDHGMKMINTREEKYELLEKCGVNHLVEIPFTKSFSRTSSLEFVRDVLINAIGTKTLVIGYNHQFGRNREGGYEKLKEYAETYSFNVEEISAQDVNDIEISSTKIRKAIEEGAIQKANAFLGYDFFITGKVFQGRQLGRTIGFPTANIFISESLKILPANGVYAVKVMLDGKDYNGMLNIGNNPTVNGKGMNIEVHIFDFDKDIYNETIRVLFKERIRDEVKFDSIDALKAQLNKDRTSSLEMLKN